MLKKKYRLLNPKDFNTIFNRGKKYRGEYGMLIALNSNAPKSPSFGIVVNKKIGNSVQRHKLTRQIRSTIHQLIPIKEAKLKDLKFSYIAFKNPDTFSALKSEIKSQIDQVIKHIENEKQ